MDLLMIDGGQATVRLFDDDLGLLILAGRIAAEDLTLLAPTPDEGDARSHALRLLTATFEALLYASRLADCPPADLTLGGVVNAWQPRLGNITRE